MACEDKVKLEDIGFYSLSDKRAADASPGSQMKRCEMIITEYCNFKCPYCRGLDSKIYEGRRVKQLSLSEIKYNIDQWCLDGPLENIRFSGGEPTLHKDIVEIVSYAKSKDIKRIAISTNGSADDYLYRQLVGGGCNDFSISLDACCASAGDSLSRLENSWRTVVDNIQRLSRLTYVTVGIVLTPENIPELKNIIEYANSLGVSDIRIIPSAQWDQKLPEDLIPEWITKTNPVLKYRLSNIKQGRHVRGLTKGDSSRCPLILDDSVIAGNYHFPCVIYMREQGAPIGIVSENMRKERIDWVLKTNTHEDPVCNKNCLDVCIDYNNKAMKVNTWLKANLHLT
jgi:MoaA/NifB/PqqE/SkfB family radical SAM enzyme